MFLHEYANKNFQRDNKDKLKNIKSRRKLWLARKNLQSDMEEEVKRLKFFQDSLKVHISNMKEKEQITKRNLLHVKRHIESASMRIATKVNVSKLLTGNLIKKDYIYYICCTRNLLTLHFDPFTYRLVNLSCGLCQMS